MPAKSAFYSALVPFGEERNMRTRSTVNNVWSTMPLLPLARACLNQTLIKRVRKFNGARIIHTIYPFFLKIRILVSKNSIKAVSFDLWAISQKKQTFLKEERGNGHEVKNLSDAGGQKDVRFSYALHSIALVISLFYRVERIYICTRSTLTSVLRP